ncbi:hypothetical protein D3C80_263610 [compost metagenome]
MQAEARRQFRRERLHLRQRLTRGETRSRRPFDRHGGQGVITADLLRPENPVLAGDGRKIDEIAIRIRHPPESKILRPGACQRLALHVNALHASLVKEVIHIGTRPDGGQERADIRSAEANGAGLAPVDVEFELGSILHTVRPDRHEFRALRRQTQQHVARFQKLLVALAGTRLEEGGKAVGIAEFRDRRRYQRNHDRFLDAAHQRPEGTRGDGLGGVFLALALFPVLQLDEHHAHVLALTGKGETTNREDRLDVPGFGIHVVIFHLAQNRLGILRGRTGRRLDDGHQGSLILVGKERSWRLLIKEDHGADQ